MNIGKFISALILVAELALTPTHARHGVTIVPGNLVTAKTLIGEGDVNGSSNRDLNVIKWGTVFSPASSSAVISPLINSDGYPLGALTTSTSYSTTLGQFPVPWYSQTMVIRWTGRGGGTLTNNGMLLTPVAITGTGCSFAGGLTVKDSAMTVAGTNCYATFSMALNPASAVNGTAQGMIWSMTNAFGVVTYDGTMAGLEMYLLAYEAQRNLCQTDLRQCILPEYISNLQALNPKVLRAMDWSRPNFSNITSNINKRPTTYLTYNSQTFPAGLWSSGGASGTLAFTTAAATQTPVSYTDGETIQTIFANASPAPLSATGVANNGGAIQLTLSSGDVATLSGGQRVNYSGYNIASGSLTGTGFGYFTITVDSATQITLVGSTFTAATIANSGNISTATLDVGSRGAKLLTQLDLSPIKSSTWAAGATVTLVYDGWLDIWIASSIASAGSSGGGLIAAVPIEILVATANRSHVNLRINFPLQYDAASMTATTTYVRDNLSSDLEFHVEMSNEVWNSALPQWDIAQRRGVYLGFPTSSGRAENGYYSLRIRQMSDAVRAAWSPRTALKLQIVTGMWSSNPAQSTMASNVLSSRDLASVANGGSGNANWITQTGNANYTTAGSRTVDITDEADYATYWAGAQLNDVGLVTMNAKELAAYKAAVDAFNSGNLSAGYQWLDSDIRQGTTRTQDVTSISGGDTFNITAHGYSAGQVIVATTTGVLPTGLSLSTAYEIIAVNANSFKLGTIAAPSTPIAVSGGSGTMTVGLLAGNTLLWTNQFIYAYNPLGGVNPGWEAVMQSYDAYRTSVGQALLKVGNYEGGWEDQTPSIAQYDANGLNASLVVTFNLGSSPGINWTAQPCHNGDLVTFSGGTTPTGINTSSTFFITNASTNAFDVSSTYNNPSPPFTITLGGSPSGTTTAKCYPYTVNNLLDGWKKSAAFGGQFVTDTYNQFKNIPLVGGESLNHSAIYGWFALQGGVSTGNAPSSFSQWSLQPGNSFSTPYVGFDALGDINRLP